MGSQGSRFFSCTRNNSSIHNFLFAKDFLSIQHTEQINRIKKCEDWHSRDVSLKLIFQTTRN